MKFITFPIAIFSPGEIDSYLKNYRKKIKGIQTVIAMFESPEASNGKVVATKVASVVAKPAVESPVEKTAAKSTKTGRVGRPRKSTTAKPAATKKQKASSKATAKKTASTAKKTTRGMASNWQSYVRDDFSKTPLPDVVENILKAQPKSVFKIAAVMSEIFPDDMPKNHFLKARNRISNILSAGARSGEWHRGRGGTYSCNKKALQVR